MNPYLPGSYRPTQAYLSDVPQISDELVRVLAKTGNPPDDLAAQGERQIAAAMAKLREKREKAVGAYVESEGDE